MEVKKVEENLPYVNDRTENAENIHKKLVEVEDCSRRNNIRIDQVKENSKESWEGCETRFIQC